MKILYFASSKAVGLVGFQVLAATHFSKVPGIDLSVISGSKEQFPDLFQKLENNKIKYIKFTGIDEKINFFKLIIPFYNYLRKERFDIIHAQTITHLLYAILTKFLFGHKIYFTIHYIWNDKPIKRFLISLLLSFTSNIFVYRTFSSSPYLKNHFKKYKLNTFNLPLGFEIKNINSNVKNVSGLKIIYLAVFRPSKGHFWLIQSLAPLIKVNSDIVLTLPGEGEFLGKCKDLVKQLGLENNIIFPGFLDRKRVEEYLKQSNLAIVPSKSETFGLCIVEPMLYGIPVISTKTGIAPDLIKDGYNGCLIDYGDAKSLLEKVLLFYNDKNKIKIFGDRAKALATERLNIEKIAQVYAIAHV